MKRTTTIALLISATLLTACHKREKEETPPASAAASAAAGQAPAPAAPPAAQTPDQEEMAKKQALLDYGVMEDKYLNDARGQWANSAKASSVFGDENSGGPAESNMAKNVIGPSDSQDWTNNNIDKGFDWIELGYAKPVNATEVRVVMTGGAGVEALNKVELQDTDGKWNVVWTGLSDVKRDERGSRTWFVRTFDKTAYKAKAVKITLANNLQHAYKEIDAVQLVGD